MAKLSFKNNPVNCIADICQPARREPPRLYEGQKEHAVSPYQSVSMILD